MGIYWNLDNRLILDDILNKVSVEILVLIENNYVLLTIHFNSLVIYSYLVMDIPDSTSRSIRKIIVIKTSWMMIIECVPWWVVRKPNQFSRPCSVLKLLVRDDY